MGFNLNYVTRIFQRALWRLMRLNRHIVLHAPPDTSASAAPKGLILFRANKTTNVSKENQIEAAMQSMGEPAGLVADRFSHGDEFFGWFDGNNIICFGWVTYRERFFNVVRYEDMPGRVFLYNFQTSKSCRGQGLYPALLLQMRQMLSRETRIEFIIEVNSNNTSSLRGIEKAGFIPIVKLVSIVFLNHWHWLFKLVILDDAGHSLVAKRC